MSNTNFVKRAYLAILRLAWLIGGQKEHTPSKLKTPPNGFISEDATIIFPEKISLAAGAQVLPSARLICAEMPPYLSPSGTIELGVNSIIREGSILQTYGGHIKIGNNTTINPYCVIQGNGNLTIGDNTLIAAHVKIFTANHNFDALDTNIRSQGESQRGVKIGSNVWIGAGCTILDGVEIGNGAVVAAGAVVHKDVPVNALVAGVPAAIKRFRGEAIGRPHNGPESPPHKSK